MKRREFIHLTTGGLLCLWSDYSAGKLEKSNPVLSDNFSFMEREGLGPYIDAPQVQNRYCQLHPEKPVPKILLRLPEYRNAVVVLREEFIKQGMPWRESYSAEIGYQHYGVASAPTEGFKLLAYCQKAQDYIGERFGGKVKNRVDWKRLTEHSSCPNINQDGFRGLIGRYTYFVIRVSAVENGKVIPAPYLLSARPVERAINNIVGGRNAAHPTSGLIYIIPGITALLSPFTEILHLLTHEPSLRYQESITADDASETYIRARILGEAFTEALGLVCALRYLERYGDSKSQQMLIKLSGLLSEQMPLLQRVLQFIIKYGANYALELYMDDPVKAHQRFEQIQIE